jgi:hypothetical protein
MLAFWLDVKPHRYWARSWLLRLWIPLVVAAPFLVLIFQAPVVGLLKELKLLEEPSSPEWVLAAWGLCALSGIIVWLALKPPTGWRWSWFANLCLPAFAVGLCALGSALYRQAQDTLTGSQSLSRNFYGVLRVTRYGAGDPDTDRLVLRHGRISHGCQLLSVDGCTRPTTYYWEGSGVGLAVLHHPRRNQGLHVGTIGLGTGTMAAYGRKGDRFRFYEINPDVLRLATKTFTYLENTKAEKKVVMGDARLSLENELRREERQEFDVLVIDAFSGDAIPVHLLTKEAFEIYLAHMRPDGIIAVHISNRYLDLEPVVYGLADHFDLQTAAIEVTGDDDKFTDSCTWILVTKSTEFLQSQVIEDAQTAVDPATRRTLLWTDAHSDLFRVLKK